MQLKIYFIFYFFFNKYKKKRLFKKTYNYFKNNEKNY